MKIVLDSCVPQPLRHHLTGHDVVTARFLNLNHLEDADLLNAIDGHYDILVTCDRGIPWQNQFAGRDIAVAVLRAPTNTLPDLLALMPLLLEALPKLRRGEVQEIGG